MGREGWEWGMPVGVGSGSRELSMQLLRGRAYFRYLCIFEVPLGWGGRGGSGGCWWEWGVDGANFPFSCCGDGPTFHTFAFLRWIALHPRVGIGCP